jgi:hypothetical protein
MNKITQVQRNLFNPYKNVSLIFKKELGEKNNACIGFDSEISFDEEDFSDENFKQNLQIDISGMSSIPREHRNDIHPLANRVMQTCKLNLVLIAGERKSSIGSPQSISFSKKENGYRASLYAKVKDPSHLSAILASINQSTELSVKIDLLCDDAEFAKLEVEKGIEVIVFALSMSFNLPSIDSIMESLK